ncbi:MAG: Acetyl-coenzyme A carboxylase carboxyl transferase subunit beta [Chlamydiia bacterium]|nr:Acetyl-coenzyme A carboxylase carboxyl transferase subunit beta [Chlamydiia bacterium]MCH9624512.1 Acetyl-coenzyme A carboxylase carboxyl transferase subunit beta [Chlamydiia bacterium]
MQAEVKESFTGWSKCVSCAEMIHESQIAMDLKLCPKCDFHFTLSVQERIDLLADDGTFEEKFQEVKASDILGFVDSKPYQKRLEVLEKKAFKVNAITTGICKINEKRAALAVMDFAFMGGSLGRGEGEKLTCLIEYATDTKIPLVIVCASGGARMQESMYALMQMAKTSAAIKKHKNAGLFYLSVLTNPTMGGVSASFAFLGDVIIAEPKALIGFAGPRVIEQTIGEKLDPGDQRAEFQLKNGMIDQIVTRKEMKNRISYFISIFHKRGVKR